MITFEVQLDPDAWTEIAFGYSYVAFDLETASAAASFYMSETAATPVDVTGNPIATWPESWDFVVTGMDVDAQRLWVKGSGLIRGVRA